MTLNGSCDHIEPPGLGRDTGPGHFHEWSRERGKQDVATRQRERARHCPVSTEREKYSERRGTGAHEMEIQLAHATEDREEQQRRDAPGSEAAIIRCAGG